MIRDNNIPNGWKATVQQILGFAEKNIFKRAGV